MSLSNSKAIRKLAPIRITIAAIDKRGIMGIGFGGLISILSPYSFQYLCRLRLAYFVEIKGQASIDIIKTGVSTKYIGFAEFKCGNFCPAGLIRAIDGIFIEITI